MGRLRGVNESSIRAVHIDNLLQLAPEDYEIGTSAPSGRALRNKLRFRRRHDVLGTISTPDTHVALRISQDEVIARQRPDIALQDQLEVCCGVAIHVSLN